jgi:hypothetical protein
MKNTLSENMNRYGTKNLSESEQTKLIIRSIMETIDQHGLYKVIKNKLAEQNQNAGAIANQIIQELQKSLIGMGGDDEQGVLDALNKISNQEIYDKLMFIISKGSYVRNEWGGNYESVTDLIKAGGISKPGKELGQSTSNPVSKFGMGWSDEEWTPRYENILKKFEPRASFTDKPSRW